MSCKPVVEYLEKYLVAPSPSRDYYGIKVIRDQVILYTWKVSHGPHYASPIVRLSRFTDFGQDRIMQNEIQWVFGDPMLRHVRTIASNKTTLITLPKHLVKKILKYLNFKDVLKLSTLSRMANEIFNGDTVWEVLYKRHKMGLLYKDETEKGCSSGWRQLFKERQMYRPAKERKLSKLSTDRHLVAPRSSRTIRKEATSFTALKNPKEISSTTKLLLAENRSPKPFGLKIHRDFYVRPSTASKKKSDAEATGSESFVTKNLTGDGPSIRSITKPKMQVKKQEESVKSIATISGSKIAVDKQIAGSRNLRTVGNRAKIVTRPKNSGDKIICDDKKSASSIIGTRKNDDRKSQGLLKSNLSSARRIKCKSVSNSESLNGKLNHETTPTISTKKKSDLKSGGKSVTNKMERSPGEKNRQVSVDPDIGIDELIRESVITGDYLNSEIFDRYTSESNSGEAKKRPMKGMSKTNFLNDKNASSIYEKFSTPRKPATVVEKKETVPEKKFADIKVYLGCDRKFLSRGEKKLDPTKYKSRILPKTESCKGLDSKLTRNKSTRGSELLKKRDFG